MKRHSRFILHCYFFSLVILAGSLLSNPSLAQSSGSGAPVSFTFQELFVGNAGEPSGAAVEDYFNIFLNNGEVAFTADLVAGGNETITNAGGTLVSIDSIPGVVSSFRDGVVTVRGTGLNSQISRFENGVTTTVVDSSTLFPGREGNGPFSDFSTFGDAIGDANGTTFTGNPFSNFGDPGLLFAPVGTGLVSLLLDVDNVPNMSNIAKTDARDSTIAFTSSTSGSSGVSLFVGDQAGVFSEVVESNVTQTDRGLLVNSVSELSVLASDVVAFRSITTTGVSGIHTISNGIITTIADENDLFPGRLPSIAGFDNLSGDGDLIAFTGIDMFSTSSEQAIFASFENQLFEIASQDTIINGNQVASFDFNRGGVDGNQLAFSVVYTDGTPAIILATAVPEPSGLLLLVLPMMLSANIRHRRVV